MTYAFGPFGGGSRVVSLWDMLRFHADTFLGLFNLITDIENVIEKHDSFLENKPATALVLSLVERMLVELGALKLHVSAAKANNICKALTLFDSELPAPMSQNIKRDCKELRERIVDELKGRTFYYIADHADLLSNPSPFGDNVDTKFPSARYDISEAGRCLALRRSTACVLHSMRVLEFGLSSLCTALDVNMPRKSWETVLNKIQKQIGARSDGPSDEKWKSEDEQFFSQAVTHFRVVKNAWRNHAVHARTKYADEEAEEIYGSVRSFMRHLSERLSEEEQSS